MAKNRVLTLWDEEGINKKDTAVLRKKCSEVAIPLSKEDRADIQTLIESFLARDDASGLAAPQIGISKRIIVFRIKGFEEKGKIKPDEFEVLVNPRITQKRGEQVKMTEGCLSCPDIQVEINRFPEIKVRALSAKGEKISKKYLDYVARIVQHEADHLDGVLIVDYEGDIYFPKSKEMFFNKIFG